MSDIFPSSHPSDLSYLSDSSHSSPVSISLTMSFPFISPPLLPDKISFALFRVFRFLAPKLALNCFIWLLVVYSYYLLFDILMFP